jgi:type IV pilus assembly protein PilO
MKNSKASKFDLKNPKLRVPILAVLLAIGMGGLWYQQFYTSAQQEVNDLERLRTAKQDTLRTVLALKPQLNVVREELRLSQIKLDSLKSIFPDQKEVPKLIRELTGVARASGITTTKFNPLPDVEKEYYVENRYNIAVIGGYHELAEFFAFLANFPLIINYSSMDISANPEALNLYGGQDSSGLEKPLPPSIVSTFEMTTFSSKK